MNIIVSIIPVAALLLHIALLVITGLKGRWVLFAASFLLLGLFGSIPGALMRAKPGSKWAKRYDAETPASQLDAKAERSCAGCDGLLKGAGALCAGCGAAWA